MRNSFISLYVHCTIYTLTQSPTTSIQLNTAKERKSYIQYFVGTYNRYTRLDHKRYSVFSKGLNNFLAVMSVGYVTQRTGKHIQRGMYEEDIKAHEKGK